MMKILFTNTALDVPAGTELSLRDHALGLRERGYTPMVFSPVLGRIAESLREQGIEVVNDLTRLSAPPDFIYGQHYLVTMLALLFFPEAPAIFHCHSFQFWQETPPIHPRIYLYVAVAPKAAARILAETGVEPDATRILFNYVDLQRFRPARSAPPNRLAKALIFNRNLSANATQTILEACRAEEIECDPFASLNPPLDAPEEVLGRYDLIFAVGKSALEAMATRAAVITATQERLGELVHRGNMAEWQTHNFSSATMDTPITVEGVREQIRLYQPADQTPLLDFLREHASWESYLNKVESMVQEVMERHRQNPKPDPERERACLQRFVLDVRKLVIDQSLHVYRADALQEERDQLTVRLAALQNVAARQRELLDHWEQTVWGRLRRFVDRLRGSGPDATQHAGEEKG